MSEDTNVLASVEFEVFGDVQGCYFTKYCKEMAQELNIGGWVKNTKKGTIVGRIQGAKPNLDKMDGGRSRNILSLSRKHTFASVLLARYEKHRIEWLSTKGSPDCKINKCELSNFEYVARLAFNNFSIRF